MIFLVTLSEISGNVNDWSLVILDIESLYTSIPYDGGVEAVTAEFFEDGTMDGAQKKFVIQCLMLLLHNNYLQFEGVFFTAIGSNVAPSYTNIFMNLFEKMVVYTNELFKKVFCKMDALYGRYFPIMGGATVTLEAFVQEINSALPYDLGFNNFYRKIFPGK